MANDNYVSNSTIYVCIEETPDDRGIIRAVLDNEESAREWIRQEFLKFKNGSQNEEEPLNNEDFTWYNGEDNGHQIWECYYLHEPYGWRVTKMDVLSKYSGK